MNAAEKLVIYGGLLCLFVPIAVQSSSAPRYDEILPQFDAQLENITATQGRDVHFTCIVNHLGNYRVAWIKSDNKAILAIHNRMVAHNSRLSVTHNGHNTWKLHIYNIQKNDTGSYMCQVNTDPMRSQIGNLNVTVPPDILNDENVPPEGYQDMEGGTIKLKCVATGEPEPEVSWKREDGKPISLRADDKSVEMHDAVVGENLTLTNVNRSDMGSYLCLARSSIPPIMSKRFDVRVNFHPSSEVKDELVYAPVGGYVELQCRVEASPRATFQWLNMKGEPLLFNSRMNTSEIKIEPYIVIMKLKIQKLEKIDFGEYTCVAENTVGRAEGKIRLRERIDFPEIVIPTTTSYSSNDQTEVKHGGRYSTFTNGPPPFPYPKKPRPHLNQDYGTGVTSSTTKEPRQGLEGKYGENSATVTSIINHDDNEKNYAFILKITNWNITIIIISLIINTILTKSGEFVQLD